MADTIQTAHLTSALNMLLDETFDSVSGQYLDKGTSLVETLATISALDASIPVGGRCATLAQQVRHTAFYLETLVAMARTGQLDPVDLNAIWLEAGAVGEAEWTRDKQRLADARDSVRQLIKDSTWSDANSIAGAIAMIAHCAYHLGEIRQALCVLWQ
jgi:hypothetical protein